MGSVQLRGAVHDICRIRITAVRDCVGCYMMMLLMVVCRTVAGT